MVIIGSSFCLLHLAYPTVFQLIFAVKTLLKWDKRASDAKSRGLSQAEVHQQGIDMIEALVTVGESHAEFAMESPDGQLQTNSQQLHIEQPALLFTLRKRL
ncbi:hypothetical protein B0T24DRAFT_599735 [Lasiosphaeria ovina]|uniref:Uncharacterized protein n=1 Tax=Lasiosphaeria ovina TaxID=92902 RepID=A0AAE0JSU8_9PEZI|nr:hypothetical protein B0T24DRAFT_599735 [Lasiosphaeria ovina]